MKLPMRVLNTLPHETNISLLSQPQLNAVVEEPVRSEKYIGVRLDY